MSGWIKWEKSIETDPRVLRMARKVERRYMMFDCDVTQDYDPCNACALPAVTLVCGALARMWAYADTHLRDDDVLDLGPEELDFVVGLPGFAELCPDDWLEAIDDEHVKLPNYQVHNGTEARRKALTQKRVETHRKRKGVTPRNDGALPDQTKTRPRPDHKKQEVPSEPCRAKSDDPVERIFDHWKTTHGHLRAALDGKRRKLIRDRLKDYSEADLCQAITGYTNSPHHMGTDPKGNGTVYDSIGLFLRDSEHVDMGLRFYAQPPDQKVSSLTRRNIAATHDWIPPELRHADA